MNLPAPILRITDGTDSVDLISPARGWHLTAWEPSYPNEDIGYRQSPLASGRAPVTRRYDYPVEQMTYVLDADSQDVFIAMRRKLDRLLIKATDYWKDDWRTEPVWLEARGTYESDARYAVVVSSKIGPYPYPYGSAFANRTGSSTQDGISLSLEHTFWQDEIPGASHCIEASATQEAVLSKVFRPTEQDDDAWTDDAAPGSISLNSAELRFGEAAASKYDAAVRFRSVTVPQGATIIAAYITYVAENNLNADTVNIRFIGEDVDNAAIFTTYNDFYDRLINPATAVITSAYVNVATYPAHVAGTQYLTSDIKAIVQEIVDRPGWASGNNMVICFHNLGTTTAGAYRDMSSFDSANAEPELHIVFENTSLTGRSATCAAEVYVANKHNDADVTHILLYDSGAGTYSANQKGAALPHELFSGGAGGPANGDITYFGSECLAATPRPFCSLVFDVGTAATYGAGDLVTWQYWNGAWVNLGAAVLYDQTTGVVSVGPTTVFASQTGAGGVYWIQPSDWAITVVNGVSGYWIRFVVTEATAITRATQQTRQVYSVITSFMDIDDTTAAGLDQLRGDLPLPVKITHIGQGYYQGDGAGINRILIGMRTVARGTEFRPYINLGNTQNSTEVSGVTALLGALTTSLMSPTGLMVAYTFPAAITAYQAVITAYLYRRTYGGRFHAFVRYNVPAGTSGDLRMRVIPSEESNPSKSTPLIVAAAPTVYTADLGTVEIPAATANQLSDLANFTIAVEQTVAVARTVNLIDLILIPADEWLGDFQYIDDDYLWAWYKATMDSVTYAKIPLLTEASHITNGTANGTIISYAIQPLTLQPRIQQRLWYYMEHNSTGATYNDGVCSLVVAAEIDGAARYLNLRGDD
jgi:hypothetical protein